MRRLAAAALLASACAAPPPSIPIVILPGLEKRVDPASPAPAAPPPLEGPLPVPEAEAPPPPAPPTQPAAVERTTRAPVPLYPTPDGRLAYLGGRVSFDLPRGWKAPVEAPGGTALVDGDGRSGAGVSFFKEGEPGWESPADYKRRLRSWGSVEDSPLFKTVTVGGRYGTRRRWTTHRYKGPWLKLGRDSEVFLTETLLIPDLEGIYVVWFRAPKEEFAERRGGYAELLKSLRLPPAGPDAWRPTPKERRLAVPAWD